MSNVNLQNAKTLVTTMGGQAQVVTFALDWLLAQGESIGQVIVLHLSPQNPRVDKALRQLAAEFANGRYARTRQPVRFRPLALGNTHGALSDIRDEAAAETTWQTVYRLIAELKAQGSTLHLCIAGGRRIMGLMAMSAAMLHFDHQDRLWHLYTPDDLRQRAFEGALMHVEETDGVRLIQVPIAPLGAYFPALRALAQPVTGEATTSQQALSLRTRLMEQVDREHCQAVLSRLTPRQVEVLRGLAQGMSPQEVADQLGIALKTLDSHKTVIFAHCRTAWALSDAFKVDYHFLKDKFGPVFPQA
jgi:CRISPR-associated protein Csx14